MANLSWELTILSGILGFISGGFLSITFFRLEKVWARLVYSILIGGSPIPGLVLVFKSFQATELIKVWCYITFFILLIVSFIGVLIFLLKKLDQMQGDPLEIRVTDILLGYKNSITDYYNNRKKEADINLSSLQNKVEELKQKEVSLKIKENSFNEKSELLDEQLKNSIRIIFPENYLFPVTNAFINGIPNRAKQFQRFAFFSSILADDIGKSYVDSCVSEPDVNGVRASIKLKDFAFGICSYATVYLFSNDIRIHFRYLHNNSEFRGLVTSFDDEGHTHKITTIKSKENNLITRSAQLNRSLLKEFNSQYEFSSTSKNWVNYLTIALTDHVFMNFENIPILSMGISIPSKDSFEEMLRFLNFIGIERIINQTFLQFNRYVDCKKAINNLSSQP